jgi:hypothetical protein
LTAIEKLLTCLMSAPPMLKPYPADLLRPFVGVNWLLALIEPSRKDAFAPPRIGRCPAA